MKVAIISDLVTRNPYPQHAYVCGVPINPAVLRMANTHKAAMVFIFANLRFADPDVKTLHTAARVRELNPKATLFVELIEPHHEFLEYLTGPVIPMNSKVLLRSVLKDKCIDPTVLQDIQHAADTASANNTAN